MLSYFELLNFALFGRTSSFGHRSYDMLLFENPRLDCELRMGAKCLLRLDGFELKVVFQLVCCDMSLDI